MAATRWGSILPLFLFSREVAGGAAPATFSCTRSGFTEPGHPAAPSDSPVPRGNTVSMVGNGLVIPCPLIYLHQVQGIDLPWSGRSWRALPSRA